MKDVVYDVLLLFGTGLLIGLSITLLIILPPDEWAYLLAYGIIIRLLRLCFEREDFGATREKPPC